MDDRTLAAQRPLSLPEVAMLLNVPENTLRYWRYLTSAGTPTGPRSYKIGRRVVYDQGDVTTWLAEQRSASGGGSAA